MKKCTIILAEDHALVRQGIKKSLEDVTSFEIVGEAADGLELIDLVKRIVPDVIILDISMPRLNGIDAIGEVRKICPRVKILILTMHKSEQHLCSAMSAGANGYLLKEDSDTELAPAIERLLRDEIYISPALTEEFSDDVLNSCLEHGQKDEDVLTAREKQILKLVAEGETSRDIAELLAISRRTVEHHRANLMKKLNIKNTADLVKYAINERIIVPPSS